MALMTPLYNFSQLKQIATGTKAAMRDLSIVGNKVIINGVFDYLSSSTDGCETLIPLAIPGTSGYATVMHRLDIETFFLLSFSPSETVLYKTSNGGNNWTQISNTAGAFSHDLGFFGSKEGLMTDGPYLLRSKDGGVTWTNTPSPFTIALSTIQIYGDSMVCIGGSGVLANGIKISQDRGHTWSSSGILWKEPTSTFILNSDTVFGISSEGEFTKTTNGGQNWHLSNVNFIHSAYGIYFKSFKEGYVLGNDLEKNGVIAKTTDLGQTWSTYNTGIKTTLMNMAVLNDSIALLSGTDGVLLRWNYRGSVFTSVGEAKPDNVLIKVFPNPVNDRLWIEYNAVHAGFTAIVCNAMGQVVHCERLDDTKAQIDLSVLEAGIYLLKVENGKGRENIKIVKQ